MADKKERTASRDEELAHEDARAAEPRTPHEVVAERDEAIASWKRAQADYQNLRRRLQADIDAAVQRSKQKLLDELLLVLDYLEMALNAPVTTDEGRNLHAGVEMTRTALLRALEREGVSVVPETGAFDPSVHEAVESVVGDARSAGKILSTLRRGYTSGGQVLRPAQVRVSVAPTETSAARGSSDGDE